MDQFKINKKTIIVMIMLTVILFAGCKQSGTMLLGEYNSIEEAVLDIGLTKEYELIGQVDFENSVVLSILDEDNQNWTTTLYKNNDKFSGFQIETFESVNFLNESNSYLDAYTLILEMPEGILIEIAFLEKTDKIVTDNYDNEYIQLETEDMNIFVMELDEIPEDYIIHVDGEAYTLS